MIKNPDFTFICGSIAEAFPQAHLFGVIRDPRATIKSVLDRLTLPCDVQALDIQRHPNLQKLPLWRLCFDPAALGLPGGNYVECLAWRWRLAVGRLESLGAACRMVRYEDFLADKEATLAAMARSAGLVPVGDISADLDRQYQPRGRRSVSVEAFFGPDNLARIENICKAEMVRFGYCKPS